MEDLTVAEFIQALQAIGGVYRSRDGAKPADAVTKVLEYVKDADGLTIAEWVARKQQPAKKTGKKQGSNPDRINAVSLQLAQAQSQAMLKRTIAEAKLSAAEWKALAKELTGKSGKSGVVAKDAVETHYSDRLLLNERIRAIGD